MTKLRLLYFIAPLFLLSSCYYDNKEDLYQYTDTICDFNLVSYTTDIIPIMQAHCFSCHDQANNLGNVNLEGYPNIKIYVDDNSLYGSVVHEPIYSIMPPSGQKIPSCDIDKIKAWIDSGAPEN